jgi:hypothetical protein
MSAARGYPHDILALIDDTSKAFGSAKNIGDAEAAWDHFYRVEAYIESAWPADRSLLDVVRQLKRYLGEFTLDLRNGCPSPFNGWAGTIGRLRSMVDTQHGADGYRKR